MTEWTCTKSLHTGCGMCDVWEKDGLPNRQIIVFLERGRTPIVCNTKTCCSMQLEELPSELYSQYPHLCVPDDVSDVRWEKGQELRDIAGHGFSLTKELADHLDWLHPSNTPGWKRMPDYVRDMAQRIRDTAHDMETWANDVDEVETWLNA